MQPRENVEFFTRLVVAMNYSRSQLQEIKDIFLRASWQQEETARVAAWQKQEEARVAAGKNRRIFLRAQKDLAENEVSWLI